MLPTARIQAAIKRAMASLENDTPLTYRLVRLFLTVGCLYFTTVAGVVVLAFIYNLAVSVGHPPCTQLFAGPFEWSAIQCEGARTVRVMIADPFYWIALAVGAVAAWIYLRVLRGDSE